MTTPLLEQYAPCRDSTSVCSIPAHVLMKCFASVTPQQRLSLLSANRYLSDLAISSCARLQFNISIGGTQHLHDIAKAAHTATHAMGLLHDDAMLHLKIVGEEGCTWVEATTAVRSAILPSLGATLRSLTLQNLALDALVPAAVIAACPALQSLTLQHCKLLPLGDATADSSSSSSSSNTTTSPHHQHLQHLCITNTDLRSPIHAHHLLYLATLPSLSSLELDWPFVPIHQLPPSLAGRLTQLTVTRKWRQRRSSTGDGSISDKGTDLDMLKSLANCSQLRSLRIQPMWDLSDDPALPYLSAALSQLQVLEVPGACLSYTALQPLLSMQHLTSVQLASASLYQGTPHTPCTFQQLMLRSASLDDLASLPLHSLTTPLAVNHLVLGLHEPIQQAVDSVATCKPGMAPPTMLTFHSYWQDEERNLSKLRAAAPLIKGFSGSLVLRGSMLAGAAFLQALGECGVGLASIAELSCHQVQPSFWQQACSSLPALRKLEVMKIKEQPEALVSYLLSVAGPLSVTFDPPPSTPEHIRQQVMEQVQNAGATHVTFSDAHEQM